MLIEYSIGTEQYKCYFNQGPDGPPYNDQPCSGPISSTQGGITASMPGGSFVGALASGILTDVIGRKRAIRVGSVIWLVIPLLFWKGLPSHDFTG
jgi:MFS family permease